MGIPSFYLRDKYLPHSYSYVYENAIAMLEMSRHSQWVNEGYDWIVMRCKEFSTGGTKCVAFKSARRALRSAYFHKSVLMGP